MFSGWTKAFVFVALCGILSNVRCVTACTVAACEQQQSNSCHHQSSPSDRGSCPHQNFELSSPETSSLDLGVWHVLAAGTTAISPETPLRLLSMVDTGSPPLSDVISPSISVLRI